MFHLLLFSLLIGHPGHQPHLNFTAYSFSHLRKCNRTLLIQNPNIRKRGRRIFAKPESESHPSAGQQCPRDLKNYGSSFVNYGTEGREEQFLEEGDFLRRGVGQTKKYMSTASKPFPLILSHRFSSVFWMVSFHSLNLAKQNNQAMWIGPETGLSAPPPPPPPQARF